MTAEEDRQTGHALAANQADLDLLPVGLNCNGRCESALKEIDDVDSSIWPFEILPKLQGYRLEVRLQQIEVVNRKGREQAIFASRRRALLTAQAGAPRPAAIDACGHAALLPVMDC